jgi:hypothetical protein
MFQHDIGHVHKQGIRLSWNQRYWFGLAGVWREQYRLMAHSKCHDEMGKIVIHSVKRARSYRRQRQSGNTLAEFAPTLLIAFAIIIFPLMAFGTLGTRYIFLLNAARLSAQQASRCQTFLSNNPNPGAVSTALTISKNSVSKIGGNTVTWLQTDTYIYVCPLATGTVTTPGANTALTTIPDSTNNSYNCVVKVHGTIQAVFPGWSAMIGNFPGLNADLDAWATGENFFENSSNLNI